MHQTLLGHRTEYVQCGFRDSFRAFNIQVRGRRVTIPCLLEVATEAADVEAIGSAGCTTLLSQPFFLGYSLAPTGSLVGPKLFQVVIVLVLPARIADDYREGLAVYIGVWGLGC